MRTDFAVFILSHGRAKSLTTLEALQKCGYTGRYYIIVDDEDEQLPEYEKRFGKEHIIVFSKDEAAKYCDTCDQLKAKNIVLYARNVCHLIAKSLGLTYFLELDDDYATFRRRYLNKDGKFCTQYVRDFDKLVDIMLKFLDNTGSHAVAFAQTGDFIGGASSHLCKVKLGRKVMNSFFCRTDKPFSFVGRINEDTTMYCILGSRGLKFFTPCDMSLDQMATQQNSGGLTDAYLDIGTYVKSFYTVMNHPSGVRVATMGQFNRRFHHLIDWEKTVPKIISDVYKKEEKYETKNN